MGVVAYSFGLAAFLAWALAMYPLAYDRRHFQSTAAAAMLFVSWLLSNTLWVFLGPGALQAYPVMDMVGGVIAALMFRARPQMWSAALTLCFLTQSVMHVGFAWDTYNHKHLGGAQPD